MPYRLAIAQYTPSLTWNTACQNKPGKGWIEGLEPSASRATIWRASQLRHTHHKTCSKGFEPPTHGLEGRCSIQLSYEHTRIKIYAKRVMGIEPTCPAWKAGVLPLNYTRKRFSLLIGVTGFEPATPWSQTRCSSQAEPHPAGLCHCSLTQRKIYYIRYSKICQPIFLKKVLAKTAVSCIIETCKENQQRLGFLFVFVLLKENYGYGIKCGNKGK